MIEEGGVFSGDKMRGRIKKKESIKLLILLDEITKKVKLNLEVNDKEDRREKNYVTFAIRREKRDFNVDVINGTIKVNIAINLWLEIEEYPKDHLYENRRVKNLENNIRKQLGKLASETVTVLQEANSDPLGIGEQIRAHHNTFWKRIDWLEVYPEVPINVDFD